MHRLDRFIQRLFLAPVQRPWRWPGGDEAEADWESVQIEVTGGHWSPRYSVAGLWRPAAAPSKGAVVLAHHLWPGAKGYFLKYGHARMLREAGYDVLVFDFNGFGESPSVGFDYEWEVRAAGLEAARRSGGKPVALFAQCFGAGWGAMKAVAEPGQPFQALVAVSPYPSLLEYYTARTGRWNTRRERWMRQRLPRATYRLGCLLHLGRARKARTAIEDATRAVGLKAMLLIYGERDELAPPQVGERYLAAMTQAQATRGDEAARPELWVVPNGDHPHVHAGAPDAFRERVVAFLDREMGAPT